MGITCGFQRYIVPVIADMYPKGGMGKTTSSIDIAGEMRSDTADLDTHTGPSTILGLRPKGKRVSVKVPKTVGELIGIMTPYKNSDKTLLIDCRGLGLDLTRIAITLVDYVIVPSKDSLTGRIGLMHFDGVLDEISSTMGTDITVHLYPCEINSNKERFPKPDAILPSFKYLKLIKNHVSARAKSKDVIKTGAGVIESVHGRHSAGGKEVIALIEEINYLVENDKQ